MKMAAKYIKTPFACDECSKKYSSLKSLRKHKLRHSDEKPYKCSKCSSSFRFSDFLKTHMVTHLAERIFKCLRCGYTCASKQDLEEHNRIVCRPYTCQLCSFQAVLQSEMTKHQASHAKKEIEFFPCKKCPQSFSSKTLLNKHMKMVHSELVELEVHLCEHCEFTTTSKSHLKSHELTHATEKRFKCEFCDFRAKRKQYVQKHMQKHTQQKSFKCPECDVRCTRKDNLTSHMAKHVKTLIFKCVSCTFESYASQDIQVHVVESHDDYPVYECHETIYKPHVCPVCNFRSARRGELLTHMRVHEKVKRFQCPHCPYKSSWTVGLRRHMLRHQDNIL